MAIDVMAVDRLRVCTWGRRDLPPHAEMAERMQRIRSSIAIKVKQADSRFVPGIKLPLGEAFGTHYRAEQELGDNDINNFFLGSDTRSPQKVFIKESKTITFSYLIRREGAILNLLRHPHIVTLLECGRDYLVLEQLLFAKLEKLGLTTEEALVALFDASEAVSFAHQKHLVLRDLKPEHFLFTEAGCLKLIDFGLSRERLAPEDIISGRAYVGTSEFIAPEVMRDGSATAEPASDWYSLGVAFYEILTGEIPWNRKVQFFGSGTMRQVSYPAEGPIFTGEWAAKVPPICRPILEGLLERVPSKRLSDPMKLQRMILEPLFLPKREEPRPEPADVPE